MQTLINLGADVNATDHQNRTPLMYAAADGKSNAVALLVSRLADVNIEDVDGMRALEWAQSGNNSDLASFLGLITEPKRGKKTIKSKTQKQTQRQIEKQVDKQTEKIREKQTERFQDYGKTKGNESYERFHVADEGSHLFQYNVNDKLDELFSAIEQGDLNKCRQLFNEGLKVNSSDATGQTPLMVAARTNQIEIAQFLINSGADVNKSSMSGLTALHYSALEDFSHMARMLLDNNADVEATMRYSSTDGNKTDEPLVFEYKGATPLFIAIEAGKLEVLDILINAGANVNHTLTKRVYMLSKDRISYLTGSEGMGLDQDFLNDASVTVSDYGWSPYKQAQYLDNPEILILLNKK